MTKLLADEALTVLTSSISHQSYVNTMSFQTAIVRISFVSRDYSFQIVGLDELHILCQI